MSTANSLLDKTFLSKISKTIKLSRNDFFLYSDHEKPENKDLAIYTGVYYYFTDK
jgi:hypothetical protein